MNGCRSRRRPRPRQGLRSEERDSQAIAVMPALLRTYRGFRFWRIVRQTLIEFNDDECPRLAAALAYYAMFSLPGLLVVVVAITGLVAGHERAAQRMMQFTSDFMGERAADQLGAITAQSDHPGRSLAVSLLGFAMLLIGASGVLA